MSQDLAARIGAATYLLRSAGAEWNGAILHSLDRSTGFKLDFLGKIGRWQDCGRDSCSGRNDGDEDLGGMHFVPNFPRGRCVDLVLWLEMGNVFLF